MPGIRNSPCAILLALLTALSGNCSSLRAAVARDRSKLSAGAVAPLFSRTDLQGRQVDLRSFRGKVVLIDFWASWCAPCIVEIPRLIDMQRRYGPRGFRVIGVSLDDNIAAAEAVTHRFDFDYPVLLGDAKFGNLYGGILGLPEQFLVGPDGKILHIWSGEVAPDILEKSVTSVLNSH